MPRDPPHPMRRHDAFVCKYKTPVEKRTLWEDWLSERLVGVWKAVSGPPRLSRPGRAGGA